MRRVAEEKSPRDVGSANVDARVTDRTNSVSAIVWFSLAMPAVLILTYLRAS